MDGTVFLNWDNEYIRSQASSRPSVTYGIEKDDSDYKAYDIGVSAAGSTFKMKADGKEYTFTTRLIGSHNVLNIAGAIACAHTLGVPMEMLVRQVKLLESVPHRLQLVKGSGALIIDDAYNSNPSGAKAALDTLAAFDGVKVLVTPGMVELGAKQEELNRVFGSQAAAVCDYVVLVGEKQAEPIYAGLMDAGYPKEKIFVEHDLKAALKTVENIRTGDRQKIVLLENDLPDMCAVYRQMVIQDGAREQLARVLRRIMEQPDGAVLWHCTAGKDRCGMTAVLIEYMLGFDMEDIIADYMLTNEAAMPFADRIYAHVLQLSGNEQRAKGVWRAFVADTAYLYAAFDEMEKRCGGIDGFIENGLGIDRASIESFREKILE